MSVKSTAIAESGLKTYNQVKSQIPTIPATISVDSIALSPNANSSYTAIQELYKRIEEDFKNLAAIFNRANNYVTGSKIKNRITKTANACTTQATNCVKRSKALDSSFSNYSKVQQKIDEMEFAALEEQGWTKVN